MESAAPQLDTQPRMVTTPSHDHGISPPSQAPPGPTTASLPAPPPAPPPPATTYAPPHKVKHTTKRTLLFLAVTAEEKGLLGARYYATHPLYPLKKTVANINMDGAQTNGPSREYEETINKARGMDQALRDAEAGLL